MLDPYHATTDPVLAMAGAVEHLRLALEAGELGTWRWDIGSDSVQWDERLEALFGFSPGEYDGTLESWLARVHPDDRPDLEATIERAVESDEPYTVLHRVVLPDGEERWIEGRGQTTRDDDGNVTGTIGCAHDITDRVHAEHAQEERLADVARIAEVERLNRERLEFLLQINDALGSTTDIRQVMHRVTTAAVPRLGDWCILHILPRDGGSIPEIEAAHSDPRMLEAARRMADRIGFDPDAGFGAARVIRTGQPEYYPHVDLERLRGLGEEGRRVLSSIGLNSAIIVPLKKRGRIYGAMTFAMTNDRRDYVHDDLVLAEAIAGRIASALENLRLMAQQSEIARVLQASLLPDALPDVPHFDVAVRYTSAGEGTEVGGDFYDIFPLTGQAWGVAIGDVCGKGPAAAALTGLARHTIRASAWRGDDPRSVLARLNEAVYRSESGSFCTALFGVLTPQDRTFTAASGGHPLPVLVHPDGTAEDVGQPGMLLGAFPVARATLTQVELPAGATLVLYTDGVTDVPPPDELTPDRFREIVGRCAREAHNADHMAELIDETLDAIRPASARSDDIALLILRAVD